MARISKKSIEDTEIENDEAEQTEAPAEAAPNRAVRKNSLRVTLPNGTERVYSEYMHGKHWETLANNYASSQGGEIE